MKAVRIILLSAASLAGFAAMPSLSEAGYWHRQGNQAQRYWERQGNQIGRSVSREIRTDVRRAYGPRTGVTVRIR